MAALQVLFGFIVLFSVVEAPGNSRAATSAPNPDHGKTLAASLCSNCHLVGNAEQQQANADVPTFEEIANKEGQSAGAIMAHIMMPKHPMPQFLSRRANLPTSRLTFSAYVTRSRKVNQWFPH